MKVRIIRKRKKINLKKAIEKQEKAEIEKLYQRHIRGINLFEQGRFNEALSIFRDLLKEKEINRSKKLSAEVIRDLSGVYFKLQDYQRSLESYLKAFKLIRIDPELKIMKDHIKRELAFAVMLKLATAGKIESALKLCEFRLKKNPKDMALIEVKGNLLNGLGFWEESNFCYQEVLELESDDSIKNKLFYKVGLNYFKLNELETAERYFQKGFQEDAENHLNLLGLAQVAWEKKNWPTVIGFLEKAEKLAPENVSFLPSLIIAYCQCGFIQKSIPRIQKIVKSRERTIITELLNWLKGVKDMWLTDYLFRKMAHQGLKNPVFLEELRNIVTSSSDSPFLEILKDEGKNHSKRTSEELACWLKEVENISLKKREAVERYFSLVGWLMSKYEIKKIIYQSPTEKIENVLESVFIERFKTRYETRYQGELIDFVDKIKKERNEFFSPLKEIADLLRKIVNAIVIFDPLQKGGMLIEETTNQLTFRIFSDFPGELNTEKLSLLLDFYKKRRELWKKLADFLMEGKVIPPAWASVEQWAEKNTKRLPNNQILLEELQQEGNNLKMDLILQKLEPEIHCRAYPIVSSLLKEKSPVLAARFSKKGGENNCSSLALGYFKYIRREMKVK